MDSPASLELESPATTATLLSLPQEVRDNILDIVVTTPQSPPQDISSDDGRVTRKDFKTNAWGAGYCDARYTLNNNQHDILPILLASKQLRAETLRAIHRAPKDFVVDLLLVNECDVWPTFLSVPSLTDRISTVRANIRTMGRNPKGRRSPFKNGDGGPPPYVWMFYSILERFLQKGPVISPHDQDDERNRDISIKFLELDFQSPESAVYATESGLSFGNIHNKRKKSGIDYDMRPDDILQILAYDMRRLAGFRNSYGLMLYESIGIIRFMVDGELKIEMDIGKRLEPNNHIDHDWNKDMRLTRIHRGIYMKPQNHESSEACHDNVRWN